MDPAERRVHRQRGPTFAERVAQVEHLTELGRTCARHARSRLHEREELRGELSTHGLRAIRGVSHRLVSNWHAVSVKASTTNTAFARAAWPPFWLVVRWRGRTSTP